MQALSCLISKYPLPGLQSYLECKLCWALSLEAQEKKVKIGQQSPMAARNPLRIKVTESLSKKKKKTNRSQSSLHHQRR